MAFSSGKSSVSLDDILSKVTEADILSYYLGVTEVPCIINSPLRRTGDLLLVFILLMVEEYFIQTYPRGIEEAYLTFLVICGTVVIRKF